jgi:cobalt-zinc-cadmium efflux system membrane fusion protein
MKKNITYLFLAAVIFISSCHKKEEEKSVAPSTGKNEVSFTDEQLKQISVEEVQLTPYAEEFSAVGEVSFDENNVVRIYPIVSGSVDKVYVSLGDYVKKDQLLATLLSTDISTFQRDYNVAKSDLEVDEKNLSRAQELYSSGMMSEKDFAEAKKDFANAKSDFSEKKQILELYGGSSDRLDATFRVIAPRSGYIVERNINEGTQIRTDASTNIFTISDLKTIWIWANVHESDMAKVKEGDKVTVKTIAYPDKIFKGTIKKIGTMLDPASRVIRVRTELDNEDGLLKPEMFATVIITSQTQDKIVAVPENSMVLENNKYYVMKETAPKTFEKVKITTGKRFNDFVEVTEGIKAGDRIIVNGSLFALTAFNQKN